MNQNRPQPPSLKRFQRRCSVTEHTLRAVQVVLMSEQEGFDEPTPLDSPKTTRKIINLRTDVKVGVISCQVERCNTLKDNADNNEGIPQWRLELLTSEQYVARLPTNSKDIGQEEKEMPTSSLDLQSLTLASILSGRKRSNEVLPSIAVEPSKKQKTTL